MGGGLTLNQSRKWAGGDLHDLLWAGEGGFGGGLTGVNVEPIS